MAFKKKIRGKESRYYYFDFWTGQALGWHLISVDMMEKLELFTREHKSQHISQP